MQPNKRLGLLKLDFKPGIVTDITSYSNMGGWRDGNNMRFRFGRPVTLGGWEKATSRTFYGTCRTMLSWTTLASRKLRTVGTTVKYYLEMGGYFYDITPIRATATLNGPFAASNGSATLTVTDVAHGAAEGDYVTFSGATSLGGNVTATILNANHRIASIVDADNYTITLSVTANASDTGNGGATVSTSYEITTGLDTMVGGYGWGSGGYGRGTWGSASATTTDVQLRIWFQDNFGEDLIMNIYNGGIYYWDASVGMSNNRAVTLDSLSTDVQCPTVARQVIVSDRDRHVITFGVDYGDGVMDPLAIRFSSQEDPFTWTPTATNTAGDLILGSGSEFIRAIETKREIVVWTDAALYSMQYLGPPYIYGINQISGLTSIMGPLAAVAVDDMVFWMGSGNFYIYAGAVQELPCPVRDHVFGDLNFEQSDKVVASHNEKFREIWWDYPSADATGNDRYVVYNYAEKCWYYGTRSRSVFYQSPIHAYPVGADEAASQTTENYLYNHELGCDADGAILESYIESSPIEIGDGDSLMLVSKVIHDMLFNGSTVTNPYATITIRASLYPGADILEEDATTATRTGVSTATLSVEQFTNYSDIRLRGRQIVVRVSKDGMGVNFTFGTPRIELRADGRR